MDIPLLGASRDDELGAALAAEVSLSSFGGHLKDLRFRMIGLLYPRGARESIGWRRLTAALVGYRRERGARRVWGMAGARGSRTHRANRWVAAGRF